ncbi:hypothetical protein [Lysobacter sp. BMK333-48F3]|uniref:hypothetical protein n=1 Tax=Lysobacter sp. BMK333-48F3 TaxID=2867962 RepID=UPI00210278F4|nr:hypothetical protein [Lysobacter sp. BMK333-48F3]
MRRSNDRRPHSLRSLSHRLGLGAALALAATALPGTASAGGSVDCKLKFNMSGWSVFYKTSSGSGTISCSNGQSMAVKISAKGGGLSFGKSRIVNGTGEFSGVRNIGETLGSYATAEAHAGAVRSSKAQVMTKGEVSLALAGTGQGWDVGVAFGKFTISR